MLIVRQQGAAWDRPFAVVYEPRATDAAGPTDGIHSVTTLTSHDRFAGFRIVSRHAGQITQQLVLVLPTADSTYADVTLELNFRGRYAVVTLDESDAVTSLYLSEGTSLHSRGHTLTTQGAAHADVGGSTPVLTAPVPAQLTLPDGRRVESRAP